MAGYTRQSVADIIANAVIKAAPVNAEFNAIRDAFNNSTGHKHDGTSAEGTYVPLIADLDGNNKVVVDTVNNRIGIFSEVGGSAVEQVRIQDGAIVPVSDDDVDLGATGAEFKNLYIDGIGYIDTVAVHENATIAGTLNVTGATSLSTVVTTGQASLATVNIDGGVIDATTIGNTTPATGAFTTASATGGFTGDVTGNVLGNLTGNVTGNVAGNVTGDLSGNVTSTGSSNFNNVIIDGTLNMNAGTTATITNLTDPTDAQDAATKSYTDTADALKLNLAGGTMSGDITMGGNTVTGLGTPTAASDAATKAYVDTGIANVIDSAPGALDTLNELAAALGDDASFSSTITNSIATKLPLAGGTMTGNITMGANLVTSTTTPVTADTLTRKGYVDTQDALKLNLAGGTMSGAIAMGTSKITGLGNPTSGQDAATKTYVDTQDGLQVTKSGDTMSGNLAMGSNKVTGLAAPTDANDAVTKTYVDSITGSITDAATSAANAATSEANAATSETNAANSASAASGSATAAASSYDDFDDRYLGPKSSAPALDNDGDALVLGALYFNTTTDILYVYGGSGWQAAGSSVNGTSERSVYTATSGQTTFAATYDTGFVDVFLNGVKLANTTDFTATSGTSVVLAAGATAGDIVDIVAYGTFAVADTYTKAQADARYEPIDATILKDADIGVNVQAYDATILVDADIGVTVQAYDANLPAWPAAVDATEVGYLNGVTSAIQTQLDAKMTPTYTGDVDISGEFIADSYNETFVTLTAAATVDVDCETGNVFALTTDQNTTFTFSNPPASGTAYGFMLRLTAGGTHTITYPASVDWAGATAPDAPDSGETDVLVFTTTDGGTTWYGALAIDAAG